MSLCVYCGGICRKDQAWVFVWQKHGLRGAAHTACLPVPASDKNEGPT